MQFEPKKITLKDGTSALLRSPRLEDAEELVEYLSVTAGETEFTLAYPDERAMPKEQEERFIQSVNSSPSNLMILCEIDGRIAGNCHLSIGARRKIRHRGTIAIALYRKYWNRGIGTAMMRELIALGHELGLHQLELDYIEGNERGRALYEKMGFELVAERPDAYRMKDGSLRKECIMVRKLEDQPFPIPC